jgi:hypothetical protein
MAAWNDGYETDAIRLFVRDRSTQRMADANAERLAKLVGDPADEPMQRIPAHAHHRWHHVHIHQPHFTH